MKDTLYWVILLTGLFLILFYWKAVRDVIDAVSNALGGTITKLQGGV